MMKSDLLALWGIAKVRGLVWRALAAVEKGPRQASDHRKDAPGDNTGGREEGRIAGEQDCLPGAVNDDWPDTMPAVQWVREPGFDTGCPAIPESVATGRPKSGAWRQTMEHCHARRGSIPCHFDAAARSIRAALSWEMVAGPRLGRGAAGVNFGGDGAGHGSARGQDCPVVCEQVALARHPRHEFVLRVLEIQVRLAHLRALVRPLRGDPLPGRIPAVAHDAVAAHGAHQRVGEVARGTNLDDGLDGRLRRSTLFVVAIGGALGLRRCHSGRAVCGIRAAAIELVFFSHDSDALRSLAFGRLCLRGLALLVRHPAREVAADRRLIVVLKQGHRASAERLAVAVEAAEVDAAVAVHEGDERRVGLLAQRRVGALAGLKPDDAANGRNDHAVLSCSELLRSGLVLALDGEDDAASTATVEPKCALAGQGLQVLFGSIGRAEAEPVRDLNSRRRVAALFDEQADEVQDALLAWRKGFHRSGFLASAFEGDVAAGEPKVCSARVVAGNQRYLAQIALVATNQRVNGQGERHPVAVADSSCGEGVLDDWHCSAPVGVNAVDIHAVSNRLDAIEAIRAAVDDDDLRHQVALPGAASWLPSSACVAQRVRHGDLVNRAFDADVLRRLGFGLLAHASGFLASALVGDGWAPCSRGTVRHAGCPRFSPGTPPAS